MSLGDKTRLPSEHYQRRDTAEMKTNHLFTETKQTHRALALLFGLATMICALLLLGLQVAKPAYAAITFTVNSTDDAGDADTTDNICDSNAGTAGEQCTLRAAIQQAKRHRGRGRNTLQHPGERGAHHHSEFHFAPDYRAGDHRRLYSRGWYA